MIKIFKLISWVIVIMLLVTSTIAIIEDVDYMSIILSGIAFVILQNMFKGKLL